METHSSKEVHVDIKTVATDKKIGFIIDFFYSIWKVRAFREKQILKSLTRRHLPDFKFAYLEDAIWVTARFL